jgi:hypothetical protein
VIPAAGGKYKESAMPSRVFATAIFAGLSAALSFFGARAQGATDVSAQYDGVYMGVAKPNPSLSTATAPCVPFALGKVTISQGNLKADTAASAAAINGIITEDGYVQATMALPGGAKSPLDGRLERNLITAGFLDASSGCAWLVELKRAP